MSLIWIKIQSYDFLALFISYNYNSNYAIFIPLEINFVYNSLNLFKFLSESYYFARSSNSPLWDLYNISDVELYVWNRDCVNGGRADALLAHNWEKSTLVSEERDETPFHRIGKRNKTRHNVQELGFLMESRPYQFPVSESNDRTEKMKG